MSLDEAFDAALQPLREELAALRHRLEVAERGLKRPVYDARQLQEELGFSQHESYNLLRAHGTLLNGRRRISATDLIKVYSRETESDSDSASRRMHSNETARRANDRPSF